MNRLIAFCTVTIFVTLVGAQVPIGDAQRRLEERQAERLSKPGAATQAAVTRASDESELQMLRRQVVTLRAENDRLKRELTTLKNPKAGAGAKPAKGMRKTIEDYIAAHQVSEKIAESMRDCLPCVGMSEDDLNAIVEAEISEGNAIAEATAVDETARGKTIKYTLFHYGESGPNLYAHQVTFSDGKCIRVSNSGAVNSRAIIPPTLMNYFADRAKEKGGEK